MGKGSGGGGYSKADLDNHADQLNPNNDAYWQSRGEEGVPEASDDDDDLSFEEYGFSGCCD